MIVGDFASEPITFRNSLTHKADCSAKTRNSPARMFCRDLNAKSPNSSRSRTAQTCLSIDRRRLQSRTIEVRRSIANTPCPAPTINVPQGLVKSSIKHATPHKASGLRGITGRILTCPRPSSGIPFLASSAARCIKAAIAHKHQTAKTPTRSGHDDNIALFHAMISRIAFPNSISSRLCPGTSRERGLRPSWVSTVAWMSVT